MIMEEKNNNDNFLSRWSAGTLSKEEKAQFESSKDFFYYRASLDGTQAL